MKNKMIKYPLILVIAVLISTFLLALVYNFTKPIIDNNTTIRENQIVLELFPNATITTVNYSFNNEEKAAGLISLVKADSNYIYKASVIGLFAGEVTVFMVVIDETGNFTHFKVISTDDTDYIEKVKADQFTSRFINKPHTEQFDGKDLAASATKSANPIADAIKAAGSHYGRLN